MNMSNSENKKICVIKVSIPIIAQIFIGIYF